MKSESVKMSLHISPQVNEKLDQMAKEIHTTKSDLIRRAIFLMNVAVDSKKKGNKLAVLDQADHKIGDIIWSS